jgi:hypothetical protein
VEIQASGDNILIAIGYRNFFISCRVNKSLSSQQNGNSQMTNAERSTFPSSPKSHDYPGGAKVADAQNDDFVAKGAAALRQARANVDSVIADVEEKGQQALNYAEGKGREAFNIARDFRDTLAVDVEKSVTKHPYTTLALAVGLGFLFGAIWRR